LGCPQRPACLPAQTSLRRLTAVYDHGVSGDEGCPHPQSQSMRQQSTRASHSCDRLSCQKQNVQAKLDVAHVARERDDGTSELFEKLLNMAEHALMKLETSGKSFSARLYTAAEELEVIEQSLSTSDGSGKWQIQNTLK
jgi:hypothetical protein